MHAPEVELERSPASKAVGRLAAASGIFFSHFEHHVQLPLPSGWEPNRRPDLGKVEGWRHGVLPESKFRQFRLDRMIGSYHPGHRAKWTAHELCHRLVGFAWMPGATPLWLATAARLAELLPVALWYFFDEAGVRRCQDHQESGALFDHFCGACEAAAASGVEEDDPNLEERWEEGRIYVGRELRAIARTIREGRPIPHRHATLELCSDGLAWAAAHLRRVQSIAFASYVERFFKKNQGFHTSLASLEERVWEVLGCLTGDEQARPLDGNAAWWARQDIGWRLLQIREETEGEAGKGLDHLLDLLTTEPDADWSPDRDPVVESVIRAYQALEEEWELPETADVFAVGYDLPLKVGRSRKQILAGLESVCPGALEVLGDEKDLQIAEFVAADECQRRPLARRFVDHLNRHLPDHPATELARIEAALAHAPAADNAVLTLAGSSPMDARRRLGPGVELLTVRRSWGAWLGRRKVKAGRVVPEPLEQPQHLAIRRDGTGDAAMYGLSSAAMAESQRLSGAGGDVVPVALDEAEGLLQAGIWVPAAWRV